MAKVKSTISSSQKTNVLPQATNILTNNKKATASPFNWKRFLILFGIYLLILGLIQVVQYMSPELQTTEGTLDLRASGYFSEPPEVEVFELLEKMGPNGRYSHLVIQFIDAFLFVPIYCFVYSYLWILLGDGIWKPVMFIIIGLNALVD